MAAICAAPLRVPAVRITKLDSCGTPVDGSCSWASTSGVVTIEQTRELNDRQDYFTVNADNNPCITDNAPPILKWINLTITFCNVDPELFNILTAEPLVLDDAEVPKAVGFRTQPTSVNSSYFAFEAWTRLDGSTSCSGGTQLYGYFLLPRVVQGMVGDLTLENGAATFTVEAITSPNSLWGTGPYNVLVNQSGANVGLPGPLLTAIGATDHRHMQWTNLPPPSTQCGCQDLTPTLTITATGAGAHPATLTIPSSTLLPVSINWGDGVLAPETVTSGTSILHNYAAAGAKSVTLKSLAHSGPTYTGSVTVI